MQVDDIPDEALVVRGDPLEFNNAQRSVRRHHKDSGVFGLSAFTLPNASTSAIVERVRELELDLWGDSVRVVTAGALRAAGFPVHADGLPHALIMLNQGLKSTDWAVLEPLFGPSRPALIGGE